MRIAIDIDSTLHHYWDRLSESALRRFGVDLPYEEQFDWGITRLKQSQLQVCIEDTHSDDEILSGRPYPGAVETVNVWHEAGHYIHITSHRPERCHEATARWLGDIGLQYDDLHCSYDKVGRCRELEIDVLIDDSPVNIAHALQAGMLAATISHPWNEDVREIEDVVSGATWAELATAMEPVLRGERPTHTEAA